MKCPQCSDILVTLEFDRIEIDYCTTCEGIWLDSGELETLMAEEGRSDALLSPVAPAGSKEIKRICPICSKAMKKVVAGSKGSVLIDECPDHGLWFDRGELKKTLAAGCSDPRGNEDKSALARLLDEVFVPCWEKSR